MSGDLLKSKIIEAGFELAEVARLLSISPQNLQGKLNSNDVKVGFVKEVSKVINRSVYWILDIKGFDTDITDDWPKSEAKPSFNDQERIKHLEFIIEEQRSNLKSKDIAINALQEALSLMKICFEEYMSKKKKK
mgnify:CR=1 FL=1